MKKKRNRKYMVYPMEFVYLVVISLVVFFGPSVLGAAKDMIFSGSLNMQKIMEVSIDKNTQNKQGFLIEDKLMIQSGESLFCYDASGDRVWKRTLKSSKTKILKWDKSYVVADLDVGRIAIINKENKIIKELRPVGKIGDVTVSKDNIYILFDAENKVIILDKNLKKCGKISQEHADIIKIVCDYNSSELILYTSSIKSGEFKTFCIVYDQGGKIVASLDLNQSLIFDIFVDDNIVMISDEALLVFNNIVRPLAELAYTNNISDTDFKNSKLYVLSTVSEGNISEKELKVYDESLNQVHIKKLPETSSKVSANDSHVLVASEKRIILMDSSLKFLQEFNLDKDIKDIQWMSEESFYVIGEDELIIFAKE